LQPDEAAANDDQPFAPREAAGNRLRVVDAAELMDAVEIGAGYRYTPQFRPGGQHKEVIGEDFTAGETYRFGRSVDEFDGDIRAEVDFRPCRIFFRPNQALLQTLGTEQDTLRQGRTFVWRVGFTTNQGDGNVWVADQPLRQPPACLAAADYDNPAAAR